MVRIRQCNNDEIQGSFPFPFDCAQGQGQDDGKHSGDCIGQGDGRCCASGIGEGEVAGLSVFEGLAADDAEGKLHRRGLAGEMDGGDAGELADGLGFSFELRAGSGQHAGEGEATEGAVDAAARVDALDDLLAEVAALGEVQGAGLAGLLREVFVADVGADAGRAFEDAELFEGC